MLTVTWSEHVVDYSDWTDTSDAAARASGRCLLGECLSVVVGVVNCLTARLRLIRPSVVHIRPSRCARSGPAMRVSRLCNPVSHHHRDAVTPAHRFVCNRLVHKFRGDDLQETPGPGPPKNGLEAQQWLAHTILDHLLV